MEVTKSVNTNNSADLTSPEFEQLLELHHSVTKQQNKNKIRYQGLKSKGAKIEIQLYVPVLSYIQKIKPHEYQHTKIQLLICTQKLFKQSELLTKMEMKQLNQKHQEDSIKNNLQQKIYNNYLFLRRALKSQQEQELSSQDRFDKLNKVIGILKRGAQQTLKHTQTSIVTSMLRDQDIYFHPLYEKLKQQYEKSVMNLQDIQHKYEKQINKQNLIKQGLQKQNETLRKEIYGLKVKVRSLQIEASSHLSKINELTQKVFQSTIVKKPIKQQKRLKYIGFDFELEIKSTKQFKLNYQNNVLKRTLQQLQQFLQNYELQTKQHQQNYQLKSENIDSNQIQVEQQYKRYRQGRKSLSGNKRINRNRNPSLIDPTVTKLRFTRTTALLGSGTTIGDSILKQGFVRTRTDRQ